MDVKPILNLATKYVDDVTRYTKVFGKRSILETKPITSADLKDLHLSPELNSDTFIRKVETWMIDSDYVSPYAGEGTMVAGHHNFHGMNASFNDTLEYRLKRFDKLKETNPQRYQEKLKKKMLDFEEQTKHLLEINTRFTTLTPQPRDCVAYRGTSRYIGESRQDFNIIDSASIGDIIVPTRGFAYGAHYKLGTYQYLGSPYDYKGNLTFEPMLIEYRIPKGAQISSNMEHDGEVVFPALSKFKLLSKGTRLIEKLTCKPGSDTPIANGSYPYKHVVLEYIPEIPL